MKLIKLDAEVRTTAGNRTTIGVARDKLDSVVSPLKMIHPFEQLKTPLKLKWQIHKQRWHS